MDKVLKTVHRSLLITSSSITWVTKVNMKYLSIITIIATQDPYSLEPLDFSCPVKDYFLTLSV